jgi:hypothetical protein
MLKKFVGGSPCGVWAKFLLEEAQWGLVYVVACEIHPHQEVVCKLLLPI